MEELHCDNAKRVRDTLPPPESIGDLARLFKAFSEPLRVSILYCMMEGEICVHDISILLGVSQPRVSNQLRILRQEHLVKTRKQSNQVFYSLDDAHIQTLLTVGMTHTDYKEV